MSKTMIRRVEPGRGPKPGAGGGERAGESNRRRGPGGWEYKFYSYDARLTLTLQAPDGASRTLRVRKEEGRTWD